MIERKETNSIDRRKHTRFNMNDGCHIQHEESVCCVKNISMGGLACKCTGKKECNKEFLTKANIFCKQYDVAVSEIEMKAVDSTVIPGALLNCFRVRECRFKFENLEKSHAMELEKIIVNSSFH